MFAKQVIDDLIREGEAQKVDWSLARCSDGVGTLLPLFFSEQLDDIATAKQICALCPVQEPCLEFALETNQESGVWGGTSEEERRVLRRQRARRTA